MFQRECRMCLGNSDLTISIAEKIHEKSIWAWLAEVAPIKISLYDGYSQVVCVSCSEKVAKIARMRHLIQATRAKFRAKSLKAEPEENSVIFEPKIQINEVKEEEDEYPTVDQAVAEPSIAIETNSDDDKDPLLAPLETSGLPCDVEAQPETCGLCDKTFSNQYFLKKHIKTTHPADETAPVADNIRCELCDKTFPYNWALTRHMLRAHPDRQYKEKRAQCFLCRKVICKKMMSWHLKHHGPHPCSQCPKVFQDRAALYRHKKWRHRERPPKIEKEVETFVLETEVTPSGIISRQVPKIFKCNHCQSRYISFNALKNHMLNKHDERITMEELYPDGAKPFECSECLKSYRSLRDLRIHKKRIHKFQYDLSKCLKNEIKYECDYCKTGFRHRASIAKHMQIQHLGHLRSKRHFRCKTCNELFSYRDERDQHQDECKEFETQCCACQEIFRGTKALREHYNATHPEPKPQIVTNKKKRHECPFCLRRFLRRSSLDEHYRSKEFKESPLRNKRKPVVCENCGKMFGSRFELRTHEATTHNEGNPLNYTCDFPGCGKKFAMKHLLTRHSKYHKPKKFSCTFCGAAYFYNKQLQQHIDTHHQNGALLTCQICFETFDNRDVYEEHVQSHKRFKCDLCYKGYLKKTDLNKHKKAHMGTVEKFSCQHCSKEYRKRFDRNKHQDKCPARHN